MTAEQSASDVPSYHRLFWPPFLEFSRPFREGVGWMDTSPLPNKTALGIHEPSCRPP